MMVRAEALASVLDRLPEPNAKGPEVISMIVSECRISTASAFKDPQEPIGYQRLTFRREQFGRGRSRWYEWTIEVQ